MKICPMILVTFLSALTSSVMALQAQQTNPSAIQPLIVEYIANYSVGLNDVRDLIANQYSSISLAQVKTSYVTVSNVSISTSYRGFNRTIDDADPLKVRISNDSFGLFCSFTANVKHLATHKTYSCNTSIIDLPLSYTKEFDFDSGNIHITDLSKAYSYSSFTKAQCKEKIDTTDATRINQAITAVQGSSIYLELKKNFDKAQTYMQENAKDQHLSKIYATNPYVYDYYQFIVNVNVSTLTAKRFNTSGIINEMSGAIAGTTHIGRSVPEAKEDFHSFYSLAFMQNMLEYGRVNYKNWTGIILNGQNMRNRAFRYRLMDLESLIPQVLTDYPKQYLAPLSFSCSIFGIGSSNLTKDLWNQVIRWRCLGSFEKNPGQKVTVLDFVADLRHGIEINVSGGHLGVLSEEVELVGLQFDYIGEYRVQDISTAASYIKEGLFQFRRYTLGTFFKVKQGSYKVELVPGEGVWVA